jgi:serine protease Do
VVQIFVTGYGPTPGAPAANLITKKRGSGSGVILDSNGYIVTNAHVVENANRVRVLIPLRPEELAEKTSILKVNGRMVGGQIVGVDLETDLAVIKVQEKNLPALELGDSDNLGQGQIVLAFGSPFGFENSVSMGVVSSVARQLRADAPVVYIQTDATINPGNSGGPLVDADGRVVGINTMIFSQSGGSEGLGFAVPSNIVRNVYEQIRETGRVHRGIIGVNAQTITPDMAEGLGLSRNWGVILGDVYPGGPAFEAGLQPGDIVIALDGKPVENGRQLDVTVYRYRVGDKITLEYLRGEETRTTRVEVTRRSDSPGRFSDLVTPEKNLIPKLGLLALDIDRRIKSMLPNLRVLFGVVVAAQSADAPAWREGFLPGDVIFSINGRPVRDLEGLRSLAADLRPGDAVAAQVQRGNYLQYVAFEID